MPTEQFLFLGILSPKLQLADLECVVYSLAAK